jgi:limonene 1,2-monooxygenase
MTGRTFGCFLPPAHDPKKSPYTALQHDIELCCLADDLGFDEVWLGEHHSGGWTTLSSPELMIAALARQTRRIKFATGVIPLPYHHPVHIAERILLLDHLTAGRVILGCGTGSFIHDMEMIGVEPGSIRARFRATLEVVQALLNGHTVNTETAWFTARKATLQLRPFRNPVEIVVASSLSDEAIELLTDVGVTPSVNLVQPWGTVRPGADADPISSVAERVRSYRSKSGLTTPIRCNVLVHVADSPAQGIAELLPGWTSQRLGMYRSVLGMPIPESPAANRRTIESLVDAGAYIVGDAATCARLLQELLDRLAEPVSLMFFMPGWLPHDAARDQLTAIANEVIPSLLGGFDGTTESMRLAAEESRRQVKSRNAMTITNGSVDGAPMRSAVLARSPAPE